MLEMNIPLDVSKASTYLNTWKDLCDKDAGALWGMSLHTPFCIIDPNTRDAIANEADNEGIFTKTNNMYEGLYPPDLPISCTALDIGGKRYGTAIWFVMAHMTETEALELLVHEAFHCIQNKLFGENPSKTVLEHLNEMDGRISALLEMSALKHALQTTEAQQHEALRLALTLRKERRDKYQSARYENVSELNEGTAVYTEKMMCHSTDAATTIICQSAADAINVPSLSMQYGYVMGSLYGLVLDKLCIEWKKDLTWSSDLGAILQKHLNCDLNQSSCTYDLSAYGYEAIKQKVTDDEMARLAQLASYHEIFLNAPVLRINEKGQKSIMGVPVPLPGIGTVLQPKVEFIGDFGRLDVHAEFTETEFIGGILLDHNDGYSLVPAETLYVRGNRVTGDRWEMVLNEGYDVEKAEHGYTVMMKN